MKRFLLICALCCVAGVAAFVAYHFRATAEIVAEVKDDTLTINGFTQPTVIGITATKDEIAKLPVPEQYPTAPTYKVVLLPESNSATGETPCISGKSCISMNPSIEDQGHCAPSIGKGTFTLFCPKGTMIPGEPLKVPATGKQVSDLFGGMRDDASVLLIIVPLNPDIVGPPVLRQR